MELENLEQITPEGLHVFMPSGTDATLYKDNDFIIVEYPELYRDKYTKEQFTKLMEEGIQIMNPPSQEVMESKKEPTLLEQFIAKGYIRPSLAEAYEKAKRKEGDVFKAMNDKDVEYLTPEFKNELLTMLDEIAKAYPDVKVRQQATTFMDALGLQEYYGTKAMKDFANKYIKLLHTHVNESVNEEIDWKPYKFTIDYDDGRPEDIIEYGMDAEDAKQNLFKSHKYLQDKPERISDGEPVKEDHEEVTLPFTMIHRSSEGPDASGEVTFFPTAFGYEYQCTEKDFNGKGPQWSTIRTIEGIKIWFRNVLFEFGAKIVTIGDETWDIDDFPKDDVDESLDGDIVTVVDIPLVTEKLYNKLVNLLYGNKQGKNRDYEQQQNVLNFLQEIEDKIAIEAGVSIDLEDYDFTVDEINAIKKIVKDERVDESVNEDYANIEKITGDNRRPGMPNKGYIVRYCPTEHGWEKQKIFDTEEQAKEFVKTLGESLNEIKEITKAEWDKTPNDYKMIRNGQKYIMYLDPKQGTVLAPCKIVDKLNEEDNKFNYMMLDRLRTDCEYFLGNGNGYEKHLWAGNVEDQIAEMRKIYDKLPEKPQWLSLEDIDKYEKDMLAKRDSKDESVNETVDVFDLKDVIDPWNYECSYVTDLEKDGNLYTAWFIHEKNEQGLTGKQIKDANVYYAVAQKIERQFGEKPQVITRQYKYAPEQVECLLLLPITGAKEFNNLQPGDKFEIEDFEGVCTVMEKQEDDSWGCKNADDVWFDLHLEDMDKVTLLNESLNEEQGPYFGNDAIGQIAAEIEAGNKSGFEPTEFGNWILNTNMDSKWEAITEPAKDFLMEKIAMPVADGHVSYDDLEIYVSENSALAREDVESFDVFSPEELEDIFVQGNELRFLVSYELQFDGQLGESFKVKNCKKKKKKLDEIDNIDYFVKSVEGENGPFASREAAANYITQQVLAGKNEADFEIITNNGEEKMEENKKAPELVTESYKVYNTVGAEVAGENTFNSWEEVNNFLQQEWGTYKASMIAENPEFGTEEDEGNFLGNYEVEIIEVPAEMEVQINPDVCPECGETECICEPCEDNKCPECGCEPCECEKEVLEAPVDVVEDFEDEHIGKSDDEQEEVEETEEVVTPEQAAEVIDKVEDAIDSLEDFINMLVDDEELTQEEQDEIEALDLPAVVEQPDETPVDESLKEDTTVLDNGKEFKVDDKAFDIVRKNLLDVMRGYGWVDVEQMQDYIKEEGLELTDEELIAVAKTCLKYTRIFDASELQDTDLQDIKDAYGTVIVVGNFKRLPKNEEVKPEPPVEDDKNEDFKDGMLTDVKDLDMPDAIAQAIDVNDDGTVMRLTDIMAEVKALKAEMEKALVDFKTDMKDILNTVKQDIQRDVNDVENKVDDTQDAVDDLVVEEEGVEEELPPEEETTEPAEEAPAEEEQEEKEEVEEAYEPTGNVIIDTTAQILREEKVSLQGLYKKLSAKGIAPTPLTKTLVEKYITTNKLSKTLLKEEEDESLISLNDGEIKSKDPAIKKFCNKGVLEDLVDTKKKADEVIAQGGTAQDVKNAIDMYAADDNEAKQAKDYAINKMKESLLNTKKNSKLSIRGILE